MGAALEAYATVGAEGVNEITLHLPVTSTLRLVPKRTLPRDMLAYGPARVSTRLQQQRDGPRLVRYPGPGQLAKHGTRHVIAAQKGEVNVTGILPDHPYRVWVSIASRHTAATARAIRGGPMPPLFRIVQPASVAKAGETVTYDWVQLGGVEVVCKENAGAAPGTTSSVNLTQSKKTKRGLGSYKGEQATYRAVLDPGEYTLALGGAFNTRLRRFAGKWTLDRPREIVVRAGEIDDADRRADLRP